jgi:hypothetical protein
MDYGRGTASPRYVDTRRSRVLLNGLAGLAPNWRCAKPLRSLAALQTMVANARQPGQRIFVYSGLCRLYMFAAVAVDEVDRSPGHYKYHAYLWLIGPSILIVLYLVVVAVAIATASQLSYAKRATSFGLYVLQTLLVFATIYCLLDRGGKMHGFSTPTDALYFSTTVMSTTGFGDIYAVGDLAKAVVTTEMLISFVLLALGASVIVRQRPNHEPRAARPSPTDPGASTE